MVMTDKLIKYVERERERERKKERDREGRERERERDKPAKQMVMRDTLMNEV